MASGDSLLYLPASMALAVPTNGDTPGAILGARDDFPALIFSDEDEPIADFLLVMPQNYAGTTGTTIVFYWSAADRSVGPDDVQWSCSFRAIEDDADDVDGSFTYAHHGVTETEPSASGEISIGSRAKTDGAQMDNVNAGDLFVLRVRRATDSASDTLLGDAQLYAVDLRET